MSKTINTCKMSSESTPLLERETGETTTAASIKRFILSLRVEPLIFIMVFAGSLGGTAYTQLKQDKICINEFKLDVEYCRNLGKADTSPEKNAILSQLAFYSLVREFMDFVPSLVLGLYTGCWCDRFPRARFYIFLSNLIGHLMTNALLILNVWKFEWSIVALFCASIPQMFLGHGFWIAVLSYQAIHTKRRDRSFRFFLIQLSWSSGLFYDDVISLLILSFLLCLVILQHQQPRRLEEPNYLDPRFALSKEWE